MGRTAFFVFKQGLATNTDNHTVANAVSDYHTVAATDHNSIEAATDKGSVKTKAVVTKTK